MTNTRKYENDLERKENAINYLKELGIIKKDYHDWVVQFSDETMASIVDLMVDFANKVEKQRIIDAYDEALYDHRYESGNDYYETKYLDLCKNNN
jgi:hypothetical protein